MKQLISIFSMFTALLLSLVTGTMASDSNAIQWKPWSDDIFTQSKASHRLVILDLEAVWCHWCHVMEEKTYSDPKVIQLIEKNFLAVRVDQDSRPDLSNRYEDYGWPATILFDSEGKELAKLSGYKPPEQMIAILEAFIADPTPGPSVAQDSAPKFQNSATLSLKMKAKLEKLIEKHSDAQLGSFDYNHKFLDRGLVELLFSKSRSAREEKVLNQTLQNELKILDPVWGGAYQYSAEEDWDHPHFEKIMSVQADVLTAYAEAYSRTTGPKGSNYLKAALHIEQYLNSFLSDSSGAFYTSQDADLKPGEHAGEYFKLSDSDRRAKGVPRVDKNSYARENGWAAQALLALYAATGDDAHLSRATRAIQWVVDHLKLDEGGFAHADKNSNKIYLGDSLSMARAFLALYGSTGDRSWLKMSEETSLFIEARFKSAQKPGYLTMTTTKKEDFSQIPAILREVIEVDENQQLARHLNLLYQYTQKETYRKMSQEAFRTLLIEKNMENIFLAPALLSGSDELNSDPLHLTIVGSKKDATSQALMKAALAYPKFYKKIEWFDPQEGPLPYSKIQYPELKTAAIFACSGTQCSLPSFSVDQFKKRMDRRLK